MNGAIVAGAALLAAIAAVPAAAATYPLPPPGDAVVGRLQWVATGAQDTLPDIARRYDVGYDELRELNPGVDPWLPGTGTRVVLPTRFILPPGPRRGIVLNVPEMRLYYFPPARRGQAREVITYPVGIGREGWQTPVGETRVVARIPHPAWYPPVSIRDEHSAEGDPLPRYVPPGPDNPLGQFALQLGVPGYLIHGTNKPYGVGMAVSHGCVRLYPEDIRPLFHSVRVGTRVRLVRELYKIGWQDGELYLEAHRPVTAQGAEQARDLTPVVRRLLRAARRHPGYRIDWTRVRRLLEHPPGIPVAVGAGEPGLEAALAAAVPAAAPGISATVSKDKKNAPQGRGVNNTGS